MMMMMLEAIRLLTMENLISKGTEFGFSLHPMEGSNILFFSKFTLAYRE